MKKIVLFASGTGSNVENIIKKFPTESIMVFTNNPLARVIEKAHSHNCLTLVFTKKQLMDGLIVKKLQEINPDLIVLAGFLLQIPISFTQAFENKIINIHPSLLPKYGGKGMYGNHVHQAVLENKEEETGITIHYVNEDYDKGKIIFQKSVSVKECISTIEIASKIQEIEHEFFPKIIQEILYSCNKG
jgi:phosphoribosylglycinamide formyltransferase-1